MCCDPSRTGEARVNKKFERKEIAIFWKVVETKYRFDEVSGVYKWMAEGPSTFFSYKPGRNIAFDADGMDSFRGRFLPKNYEYDRNDPRGLHVYYTKRDAISNRYFGNIIIPVICRKTDLIAAGDDQAVFREFQITQDAWDKNVLPSITNEI